LIPIVIKITANLFDVGAFYDQQIKMSPLTSTFQRNSGDEPNSVRVIFGSTELEVVSTPYTFWQALKDIGGMLSLLFFFAMFAGCRHIRQFNSSLKKAYYRATK
jgi:hypothetical protein